MRGVRSPWDVPPAARRRGFTLIELMVVISIIGFVLLMVPPRIDGFGASARLESAANTISSVLTAAKEQAVIDDHEVMVEFHLYDAPGDSNGKWSGWRYIVSSRTHEALDTLGASPTGAKPPRAEDEWSELAWDRLPDGVRLTAFSASREDWTHGSSGSIRVSFFPDGSVRPAHALRLESVELPRGAGATMTVKVNALTALAEVVEGEAELTAKRDPSDFH